MKLHDLLAVEGNGVITPEDAAKLNRDLATKTLPSHPLSPPCIGIWSRLSFLGRKTLQEFIIT